MRSVIRGYGPAILGGIVAVIIAWTYAVTSIRHTGGMGLPLDDSYIYLTFSRHPFVYSSGFSSGSTSALWPILLWPVHWFGPTGAFGLCLALFAAAVVGVSLVAKKLGGTCSGLVAAAFVVGVPAFAWTALSGMDVALTAALLVASVGVLVIDPVERPSRRTIAVLALTGLARPEAAAVIAFACIAFTVRRHQWRWLLPLCAPLLWFAMNRVMTGHWMPASAIAKAQWNQPGFVGSAWWSDLVHNAGACIKGMWWDANSPLPQPRVCAILYVIGIARIALWAKREGRIAVIGVVLGAPIIFAGATLASTGLWTLHHYRYLAPVLPMIALPIGVAIAPVAQWSKSTWASIALAVVSIAAIARIAGPRHRAHALSFAQGVADTNAQVVKLGKWIGDRLASDDTVLLLHDAGALAYYSHVKVVDMLGLVTEGMARVAANGPGARFEWMESLPPTQRPTHIAYYSTWLGTTDFFGPTLVDGLLPYKFASERVVGDAQMILAPLDWDHVGTGERPLTERAGWELVDRVDVADLASEDAHAWSGALGVRSWADLSAKWSLVAREVRTTGLVIDGGRTIRGGREAFTIARATGPTTLVLRTGGPANAERLEASQLTVIADGQTVGTIAVPAPSGSFVELSLELPAGRSRIEITSTRPYRTFHWFVLSAAPAPL